MPFVDCACVPEVVEAFSMRRSGNASLGFGGRYQAGFGW